jgi:hypothetical protein
MLQRLAEEEVAVEWSKLEESEKVIFEELAVGKPVTLPQFFGFLFLPI